MKLVLLMIEGDTARVGRGGLKGRDSLREKDISSALDDFVRTAQCSCNCCSS